jgi:phytol kinase
MVSVLISLSIVLLILIIGEYLWRTKRLKGEFARKFIHITIGTFVAFWPFYMSFSWIQLISLAFMVVVILSKYFNIFGSVHTVERKSWGEAMFALAIGLTAFLTSSKWIFLAAILHLSLADGLAAVIGKNYGKKHEYKILGFTKSLIGSTTFWLISTLILIVVLQQALPIEFSSLPLILLVWLPIAATIVENFGIYGLDNLFIPILIVMALRPLQFVS